MKEKLSEASAELIFLDRANTVIDCLERYKRNIADLIKLCEDLLRRAKALIPSATAHDKIVAASLPSTETINSKINETIDDCRSLASSIRTLILEFKGITIKRGVPCPTCDGTGEIIKREIHRDEGIQVYTCSYQCPTCNGTGFLQISNEELLLHAKNLANNLEEIIKVLFPT